MNGHVFGSLKWVTRILYDPHCDPSVRSRLLEYLEEALSNNCEYLDCTRYQVENFRIQRKRKRGSIEQDHDQLEGSQAENSQYEQSLSRVSLSTRNNRTGNQELKDIVERANRLIQEREYDSSALDMLCDVEPLPLFQSPEENMTKNYRNALTNRGRLMPKDS